MRKPPAPDENPAYVTIDGRRIECLSREDRSLLLQAKAIVADEAEAEHFPIARLMLVKDACQLHCLGKYQRLIKRAIDRKNARGAR